MSAAAHAAVFVCVRACSPHSSACGLVQAWSSDWLPMGCRLPRTRCAPTRARALPPRAPAYRPSCTTPPASLPPCNIALGHCSPVHPPAARRAHTGSRLRKRGRAPDPVPRASPPPPRAGRRAVVRTACVAGCVLCACLCLRRAIDVLWARALMCVSPPPPLRRRCPVQWFFNGRAIQGDLGGTDKELVIEGFSVEDVGTYMCKVRACVGLSRWRRPTSPSSVARPLL